MVRALRSELAFSRLFAMSSLHVSSWLAAVGGSMRTGGGAFVRTDCAVASHRYQQDPRAQPPDQLGRSDAHARRRIGSVNLVGGNLRILQRSLLFRGSMEGTCALLERLGSLLETATAAQ